LFIDLGGGGFGNRGGNRGSSFGRGNDRGRGGFRGGSRGGGQFGETKREFMTDSVYVGQLPDDIKENDLKKLFPKAKTVTLTPAEGSRPG
jgi:hypothetical protein